MTKLILRYWWVIVIILIFLKSRKATKKKTIVNVGDTGDNVKQLQSWILSKGYSIQIDGIYGDSTSVLGLAAIIDSKSDWKNSKDKYFTTGSTVYGQDTGLHSVDLDWLLSDDSN